MGNKDILTNKYMSNPERFADVFNAYLFDGEPVIDPAELRDVDSTNYLILPNAYSTSKKKSYKAKKYRDIIREAVVKRDNIVTYILLAVENQSDIHYAMPVRNLVYNALSYERQVNEVIDLHEDEGEYDKGSFLSGFRKDDKIHPVITLTIYWGDKQWDDPTKLSDMFVEYPGKLDKYIDDIDINLFSIIDDTAYLKCRTELRDIFQVLHYRNDKKALEQTLRDPVYQNLRQEDAEFLSELSSVKLPDKTPEGGSNMFKAIEEMLDESKKAGVKQGKKQGIRQGKKQGKKQGMQEIICWQIDNGDIDSETAMKYLQINQAQLNALLIKFRKSKASAQ